MNSPLASRRGLTGPILVAVAAALVAYYFWPRNPTASAPGPAATAPSQDAFVAPAAPAPAQLPPGAVAMVGGIPVDANGNRVLSPAGLPLSSEPLPQAKPIPVKAPAGTVVGYSVDAKGKTQPIRAGSLQQTPNTPGSYVVVDMWAEGGPAVVAPSRLDHISDQELARLRAAEAAQQKASQDQP